MSTRVERIRDTRVTDDSDVNNIDNQDTSAARKQITLANVIWFVAGVIIVLLAFRFLLSMLGANTSNGFANFIYDVSYPFVAPFFGLFNYDNIQYGVARFELYTLVAMGVYAVVAWGLSSLVTINRNKV